MVYYILKYLVKYSARLYFKDVIIFGEEKIPLDKPLVLASNHPSAFVEPCLIGAYFPIEVHFMTRGDFFIKPFLWFFNGTNQIPIYRARDGMKNLRRNNESFAIADKVMAEGGAVTIFPEATTMEVKRIRRLKNGASRLVVNSASSQDIMPWLLAVITNYENLHRWRSYVFISISDPVNPERIIRSNDSSMAELTSITYQKMKSEAIHIAHHQDDEWVNVLLQVVAEEWRSGVLGLGEREIFKLLQDVANISEADPSLKDTLRVDAEKLKAFNKNSGTFLGAPILPITPVEYIGFFFRSIGSLPAVSFLVLPLIPAFMLRRKRGISREFKIPVFLGTTLVLSVFILLILLIFLIINPSNWILWAYILILPFSFFSLRKWGDNLQKITNYHRFKKMAEVEQNQYSDIRDKLLKHFSI